MDKVQLVHKAHATNFQITKSGQGIISSLHLLTLTWWTWAPITTNCSVKVIRNTKKTHNGQTRQSKHVIKQYQDPNVHVEHSNNDRHGYKPIIKKLYHLSHPAPLGSAWTCRLHWQLYIATERIANICKLHQVYCLHYFLLGIVEDW